MISCPNKRLKDWKDLVSAVGEDRAYLLWDEHKGDVPRDKYSPQDTLPEPIGEQETQDRPNFADLIDEKAEPLFTEDPVHDAELDVLDINDFLFNGNTGGLSVDQTLANISNNTPGLTSHARELALRANRLTGKSKAKVEIVSEDKMYSAETIMQYNPDTKSIEVSLERIRKFNSNDVVVAFLHETVHSLTVDALAKNKKDRTFAEQELVDVVTKFMDKYKNSALAKEYGFKDEFEFVAEFYANPEFRDKVKEQSESLYKRFLNAIRQLFNLPATTEYKELFDTIINFTEREANENEVALNDYNRVFAKEGEVEEETTTEEEGKPKFEKPDLRTLQNKLDYLVGVAKDRVTQARSRTAKSAKTRSKKDKKEHLKNIDNLLKEMDKLSETQKWKVITEYANTLAKTVGQLEGKLKNLQKRKDTDYRNDNLIPLIESYEEFLNAYDLIDEINNLIGVAGTKPEELTAEEAAEVQSIDDILHYAAGKRASLLSKFKAIKDEQSIKELARPEYNTQVETDHRKRLYKEYVEKGIKGESKEEYAARMLATRDKAQYQADLIESAERIVSDPAFDISAFKRNWSNPLNTSSKLISILTNMLQSVREKIISQYKEYDFLLSDLHKAIIKERGNKPPSELYKDMLEQDKDGNYFFKGTYSIKFRDIYIEEFKPIDDEYNEYTEELKDKGIVKKVDMLKDKKYKELNTKRLAWLREHTVKDPTDDTNQAWVPKAKYKNKPITGAQAELLKEAISLINQGHRDTRKKGSLVRKAGYAKFYKLPSITKSDFERAMEADFKGALKQKKEDLMGVRPDDIGIAQGEAVDTKGQVIRGVKVHFRGDIDPSQQSLDVSTLLRKEFLNITNYREKSKAEATVNLLADISKNKQYFQKSKKTGLPLLNVFNKNQPAVTIKGEFTNEYKRIQGIIERNLYDTMSEHGGKFLGMDVNKMTDYLNGYAASVAMSFNLGSGVANVFNGFTQLFIEGFGADTFNTKSLLKAEKIYTLELPKTLADMANPTKRSFVNQMLEMYDVFGGFDPATQEYIRNNIAKKLASKQSMNGFNEMGEHAMNSILTMAVLDSLKVMNSKHKFIDKDGKETTEDKAASLLDMLKMDDTGLLVMDPKVKFTKHNLTTEYAKGGKVHVNLLIKSKIFDLFGVYDINFKNEVSKTALGKSVMMFKNYFISAMEYRYTGISTAFVKSEDLTEDELNYSSAKKEYIEGTYTSLVRYFKNGVIPALKGMQLMYMKDVYNSLSEYEKANLRKATIEIVITSALIPAIGAMLAAAADDDDDDVVWFFVYQFRRLDQELSQFRNPIEAGKLITNPVAGVKLIQNTLRFIGDVVTPINFDPEKNESYFDWMSQDSRGEYKMIKAGKKMVPIIPQIGKDYEELTTILNRGY